MAFSMGCTVETSQGEMRIMRGSGVVMPASSRMRMWEPYTSAMMFSTRTGEALPVRMPENSCCTTCSVLIIFSSASKIVSSSAI